MEQLQWQVIYNSFSEAVCYLLRAEEEEDVSALCFRLCQAAPSFHSPPAWVYLHQLVPVSSPCSCHFLPTLIGADCSVSPNYKSGFPDPISSFSPFFPSSFSFFYPCSHAQLTQTHFTPMVGPSGSPSDLLLSFPHHILASLFIWSGKM